MKKAFTLVEMLVVIAIIGILATAVIIALGPARTQAKDSRIRGDVQQMRSLMETYFNMNNFSYSPASCTLGSGTTCTCSTNVQDISNRLSSLCQDIRTQNGGSTNFSLVATQNSACISVQLASGRGLCMDTQGNVKETPTYSACLSTGSNAGTCP